jgi:hypothetical protein
MINAAVFLVLTLLPGCATAPKAFPPPLASGTEYWLLEPAVETGGWLFQVPWNTPTHAVGPGKVLEVISSAGPHGCDPSFRWNTALIRVQSPDGSVLEYRHVEAAVKADQEVKTGQRLGFSSPSGWSCEPGLGLVYYRPGDFLPAPVRVQGGTPGRLSRAP